MIRKILTTLAFGALIQMGFAQNFDKAKLDKYFETLEANNKFMGSVAVYKGNEIVYSKSVGYIDIADKLKANSRSKYRIGSISKTFTSVLVMKAVEMGKLELDQSIEKYFPTITNAGKISIRHLLCHRSGIHNFTNNEDYLSWNTQAKTEKEMVDIIAKSGTDFEPDSKAQYSNSNYVLLTYILEKTFNKTYADLLQEYICKPLDLQHTQLGGKIHTDKNDCKSYTYVGEWKLESETDMSVPLGAGAISSTAEDLVKFSNALFGGKLLKPESLETMKTLKDNYGLGLFQYPFFDKKGYGHTGGIDGFRSVFTWFADGNVSYAMCSNGTNYQNNNISIAVLSAVYEKAFEIPKFAKIELSSEDLDQYLGTYSSKQLPLKISFTKNKNTLIAQGTGQPSFALDASGKNKFKQEQIGVEVEFNPEEKTMVLKQGGGVFNFTKE
jgi:CubicO group peptidase (beta-lactamase class C family)